MLSYPAGIADEAIDEPWSSTSYTTVTKWDGRGMSDYVDHYNACVLDHCVVSARVTCRRNSDCRGGSTCLLSGYSADARGNTGMDSHCVSPQSGSGKAELMKKQVARQDTGDAKRTVAFQDELARARALFQAPAH